MFISNEELKIHGFNTRSKVILNALPCKNTNISLLSSFEVRYFYTMLQKAQT